MFLLISNNTGIVLQPYEPIFKYVKQHLYCAGREGLMCYQKKKYYQIWRELEQHICVLFFLKLLYYPAIGVTPSFARLNFKPDGLWYWHVKSICDKKSIFIKFVLKCRNTFFKILFKHYPSQLETHFLYKFVAHWGLSFCNPRRICRLFHKISYT